MQRSRELLPSDSVAGVRGGVAPLQSGLSRRNLGHLCSDVVVFLACISVGLWAFLVSQAGGGGGGP